MNPFNAALVLRTIVHNPQSWDQEKWHSSCGTTHCVAGWCQVLGGYLPNNLTVIPDACEFLGMDSQDIGDTDLFGYDTSLDEIVKILDPAALILSRGDIDEHLLPHHQDGRLSGYSLSAIYRHYGYIDGEGYDPLGYDKDGYDKEGYDQDGYNREGYDQEGYDHGGYNKEGYNRRGYDRNKNHRDPERRKHPKKLADTPERDIYGYYPNEFDDAGFDMQGLTSDGRDIFYLPIGSNRRMDLPAAAREVIHERFQHIVNNPNHPVAQWLLNLNHYTKDLSTALEEALDNPRGLLPELYRFHLGSELTRDNALSSSTQKQLKILITYQVPAGIVSTLRQILITKYRDTL